MYCCYTWPRCIAIHHTFVLDEELSWVQKKGGNVIWLILVHAVVTTAIRRPIDCHSTSNYTVESQSNWSSVTTCLYFFICTRYSVLQPQDWNKLLLHINVKYETTSGKWWHDLFMTTQITPRRQFDIAIASDDDWFALLMSYPTFNTVSNLY